MMTNTFISNTCIARHTCMPGNNDKHFATDIHCCSFHSKAIVNVHLTVLMNAKQCQPSVSLWLSLMISSTIASVGACMKVMWQQPKCCCCCVCCRMTLRTMWNNCVLICSIMLSKTTSLEVDWCCSTMNRWCLLQIDSFLTALQYGRYCAIYSWSSTVLFIAHWILSSVFTNAFNCTDILRLL